MRSAPSHNHLAAKKIGLLHVARKQLGLTDDEYRDILRGQAGCESSTQLDEFGFDRVMTYMNALGFRSTWTKQTYGHRPGMASPKQVELIRDLWRKYAGVEDEAGLNAWLARSHRVSALRFVDSTKARAVITALKAMAARK